MTQIELTVMANKTGIMTTTGGNPFADKQNSLAAGPRGPLPIVDHQCSHAKH